MQQQLIETTKELKNKENTLIEATKTINIKENEIVELNLEIKELRDRLNQS
jgi:hypothetical protein